MAVGNASARDEIAARDFSLDLAWLRDESADDAEDLPEPEVLAQEAMDELEEAISNYLQEMN